MKKKIISLLLVLALMVGICPAAFAADEPVQEGKILSSAYDEETNTLTFETAQETIDLIFEMVDEHTTIITQYDNGILFDQVTYTASDDSQVLEATIDTEALAASTRYFMGTVYYTGSTNPTYTMNVRVYDTYGAPIRTTYRPPNGVLSVAEFVSTAASVLGVASVFIPALGQAIGTYLTVIGGVSSGIVMWQSGKTPTLSCDKQEHTFTFYHNGTSPAYYPGEMVTRKGTQYIIRDEDHVEYLNESYYEGVFIHGPTREDAVTIYYQMYHYTDWDFIRWDSAV